MIIVKNDKGLSIDKLLSTFKRKVIESGVLMEYKLRQEFQSKSQKRRSKKNRAIYKAQQINKESY